jgi:hypothetical protein
MGGRADLSRYESQPTMTTPSGLALGRPTPRATSCATIRFNVMRRDAHFGVAA